MSSIIVDERPQGIGSPLVCVVDDDVSLLRALGRLLRAAGFTVETYSSAEEYLDTRHSARPACLVFDVRLGAMSGFELYERLRESGTAPPVVFITAHDDWATRERARRAGAVQYLRKPFEEAALIDALSRATAQTRTA
ncbi:MAG TPA: response regulator [Methylomirabilota bacterium]|nr:response regulator [Methylomirabilota bacterium]